MGQQEANSLRFKPKARIIRTIGDQLISGPEAAVIELVKNAYDADAETVRIKFFPPLSKGQGRISVADDGHGMSLADISSKWMEPATSSKSKERTSKKKTRRLMGSKGIGRFAAAKLGEVMALTSTTRSDGEGRSVLIPELNWSIFEGDAYLSDIEIEYVEQEATGPSGTTIEISKLHEEWTRTKLERLHKELRRLLPPVSSMAEPEDHDFKIYFDLSECTQERVGFDGTELVGSDGDELHLIQPFSLLSSCDYELEGKFDSKGSFDGLFTLRRAGRAPEKIKLDVPAEPGELTPGTTNIHLFIFDREAKALKASMRHAEVGELTSAKARQLLDQITGVAIYRDGFRVRPYGDPKNDWLMLDTRRVQNPSLRIGFNQISGHITIESEANSNLVERSSREGFEQNSAFERLTKLVGELLTQIVEPRRYAFRSKADVSRNQSSTFDETKELTELKRVRKLVALLAPEERAKAEEVINRESARLLSRVEELQERQRILEAQTSLGSIVGEVLHEGGPKAAFIARTTKRLQKSFPQFLSGDEKIIADFKSKIPLLSNSGDGLEKLFRNLRPLATVNRSKPKLFYPIREIENAVAIFDKHPVSIQTETTEPGMELIGYVEDLTTAIVNLVGNSIHWLENARTPNARINILVKRDGDIARIIVEDNGPGVPKEFSNNIFDVGFSLKDGGTGLGLNIAKEALARSGGTLLFYQDHRDGAIFEINYPAGAKQ